MKIIRIVLAACIYLVLAVSFGIYSFVLIRVLKRSPRKVCAPLAPPMARCVLLT
jgi:hypothetical protein